VIIAAEMLQPVTELKQAKVARESNTAFDPVLALDWAQFIDQQRLAEFLKSLGAFTKLCKLV